LKRHKKAAFVAPVGAKGFEFALRMDVDPKALGAQLRRLREASFVSASDLAERMGWNSQNVLRLERGGGGREPTISSVNLYVRRLGFRLVLVAKPKPQPRTRAGRAEGEDEDEDEKEPSPDDDA
jgi:transcriptional regulator with XRE-family HTH domain